MIDSEQGTLNPQQYLKQHTMLEHTRIEQTATMRALMSPSVSLAIYGSVLTKWLHWLAVNEPLIKVSLGHLLPPQYSKRLHCNRVKQDLQRLNLATVTSQLSVNTLRLDNPFQALGAVYVLEGSTLGSQVICKRLRSKLGSELPLDYYSGYGASTGQMWAELVAYINTAVKTQAQLDSILIGAKQVFSSLHGEFEQMDIAL